MSIEEIEITLPNGLHDAVMRKHVVDYQQRTLDFHIDIWVGDLNSEVEEVREAYKSGVLSFEGLEYFVIEPPSDVEVVFDSFSFSAGDPRVDTIKPSVILPDPPDGTFLTYLYIYKLNAFMHICATKVKFKYGT